MTTFELCAEFGPIIARRDKPLTTRTVKVRRKYISLPEAHRAVFEFACEHGGTNDRIVALGVRKI